MKALAIAWTNLRRLFRQRLNIFFILILPLLIITLLGAAFGSSAAHLGVVAGDGPLATQVVDRLEQQANLDVHRYGSERAALRAVEHVRVDAAVILPGDYDARLTSGRQATVRYLSRPSGLSEQLRLAVDSALAEPRSVLRASRFLERERLSHDARTSLRRATAAASTIPPVAVDVRTAAGKPYPRAGGRFDTGASTQLLLFIFFTSLTGATALIETRRLGISRRMLSTPTRVGTILLGEALGRFAVALVQAALIMLGSELLFGVDWGDPIAAGLLVLAFCLVGCGAGMLLGSVLSNEQQASALSLLLGLGLAAFGGSMVPLEVFSSTVRTAAHVTPHAWANDAFNTLVEDDGGVRDILGGLAVLVGYATALLGLATWRLRRALTAG